MGDVLWDCSDWGIPHHLQAGSEPSEIQDTYLVSQNYLVRGIATHLQTRNGSIQSMV